MRRKFVNIVEKENSQYIGEKSSPYIYESVGFGHSGQGAGEEIDKWIRGEFRTGHIEGWLWSDWIASMWEFGRYIAKIVRNTNGIKVYLHRRLLLHEDHTGVRFFKNSFRTRDESLNDVLAFLYFSGAPLPSVTRPHDSSQSAINESNTFSICIRI